MDALWRWISTVDSYPPPLSPFPMPFRVSADRPFMERLLDDYYRRTGVRLELSTLPLLCHPGGPAILDSLKKCAGD